MEYPRFFLETALMSSISGKGFHVNFYEDERSREKEMSITPRLKRAFSDALDFILSAENLNMDLEKLLNANPDLYLCLIDRMDVFRWNYEKTSIDFDSILKALISEIVEMKMVEYGVNHYSKDIMAFTDKLFEIMKLAMKLKRIVTRRLIAQRERTKRSIFRISNSLPLPEVLHRAHQMQPRNATKQQSKESAFA